MFNNLLNTALKLIPRTPVDYIKHTGSTINEIGLKVDTYADPVQVYASVQAVPQSLFNSIGLDYNKRYYRIYTINPTASLDKNRSGDRYRFNGILMKVEEQGGWLPIEGWTGVLCVVITDD